MENMDSETEQMVQEEMECEQEMRLLSMMETHQRRMQKRIRRIKNVPEIEVRKNSKRWLAYYTPKSNKICLRATRSWNYITEDEILKVLIHETTHWAEYLFAIDEPTIIQCVNYYHSLEHNDRLVEKIAFEVSGIM